MKYAAIIKHPGRDFDYRVDLIEVPDDVTTEEIETVIMRDMLGPFKLLCLTERVSDRDVMPRIEKLRRETEKHIEP